MPGVCKEVSAKELRKELDKALGGYASGWRLHHKAKELGSGEYAFIRNDGHCRGWRIVLDPTNKMVELQQYDPGIDTIGCRCINVNSEFPGPDPDCPVCDGTWEIPLDYRSYERTFYEDSGRRKEFKAILNDLYYYRIHPVLRYLY